MVGAFKTNFEQASQLSIVQIAQTIVISRSEHLLSPTNIYGPEVREL